MEFSLCLTWYGAGIDIDAYQGYDPAVQGPFRVFKGDNIPKLRAFLEKEDKRRIEAERRNIAFIPRDDDSMALY